MNKVKNKLWLYVTVLGVVVPSLHGSSCVLGWLNPITISPVYQTGTHPKVAIDYQGNALALWSLFDGDSYRIQSARFDSVSKNWSTINQLIYLSLSVDAQGATQQQLSMNCNGDAIAIWRFDKGDDCTIQASSYDAATKSWDAIATVTTLSNNDENAYTPQISMALANNGDGFAVWQWNNLIQSARYDGTFGWQAAVDISLSATASCPDVATSSSGNATAVWTIFAHGYFVVQASSYASGSWTPILLDPIISATGGNAYWPRVAMDSADNALAVWYHYDPNNATIQASFKPSGLPWTSVQDLSVPGQDAFYPRVAMNATGYAIVVWYRFDGQHWRIQSRHRTNTGMWSQIYTISTADFDAFAPTIAIDPSGNGYAAWKIYDSVGNTRIQFACYDHSLQQWTEPLQQQLLSQANENADYQDLAVDDQGKNVLGWQRFDGRNWRIQLAIQAVPEPPINVRGSRIYCCYKKCVDVVNAICWDVPSVNIAAYNVYYIDQCTGTELLLASVKESQGTCFYHHCRNKCCTEIYEISSVDSAGNESEKVRIAVS